MKKETTEYYQNVREVDDYHSILMALVKNSTDCIFVKDKEGIYIVVNQALANLLRKPLEQIIGSNDNALFPQSIAETFLKDDQRFMQDTVAETYEEFVEVDGKVTPFQTTKGPLIINNRVEGVFGISRDISGHKKAEIQLKKSQEHYKTLFERTGTSMGIVDTDGTFFLVNDTAAKILGTTQDKLIGKPFMDYIHPDDRKSLKGYYFARLRGRDVPDQFEYRFISTDGKIGTGLMTTVYLPDIKKTLVSVIDMTERTKAEVSYKKLFERTGTCMGIIENDGTFSLVNETMLELGEGTLEEVIGSSFLDFVDASDKDRLMGYHKQRLEGKEAPDIYEFEYVSAKGNRGTALLNAVSLPELEQTIVSIIDITEQKKAEKEVKEKTWFLESLDAVSQILTEKYDSDEVFLSLSKLILEIFQVDSTSFIYPCDLEAPFYSVVSESRVDAYPSIFSEHKKIPNDENIRAFLSHILEADGPDIIYTEDLALLHPIFDEFEVKSYMGNVIRPQVGDAWLFSLHQYSQKREWSDIEIKLYEAISERIGLALSGSLLLKQVQENEQILLQAEKTAEMGHWELDIETWKACWSGQVHNLFGVDPSTEVGPELLSSIVHKEDWPALEKSLRDSCSKGDTHEVEYRIYRPDGEERWVYCKAEREIAVNDKPTRLVGIVQDITKRKLQEQERRLSSVVFDHTGEGIMITDADSNIISVNQAFTDITGYSAEEVIGQNPSILHSDRQDRIFYAQMWHTLKRVGKWQGEIWNRKKNGEIYPEWLSLGIVKDEKDCIVNYIGLFSDITHIKKSEEDLRFLATHDALTKLPNRTLLNEQLEFSLKRMHRHNENVAVLYLDLDRFKEVNDSLGHPAGDRLLEIMAERLTTVLHEDDFVARVSGDEFVIILEEIQTTNDDVGRIAEKILEAIKQTIRIDNHNVTVTASIGIAIGPIDGRSNVLLLKNADSALYRAKEQGRNTYSYYSKELATKNFESMYLHNALYNALDKEEFVIHYQPQINMSTGEVIGTEALVRWDSSDMGMVSPGRFIPVAEETGLIIPLGEWVLRTACMQMKKWKETGFPMQYVAVNLSGRQLAQEQIVQTVKNVILETGIDPTSLELEITESVVMQDEGNIAKLNALKALGIRLSIDDFGTGYSSLARLRSMPIDKLKIDKSFVSGIPDDTDNIKITDVIIQLSRSLNLDVIAEGVETKVQGEYLMTNGCLYAQGFFYSHPQPVEDVEAWVRGQM